MLLYPMREKGSLVKFIIWQRCSLTYLKGAWNKPDATAFDEHVDAAACLQVGRTGRKVTKVQRFLHNRRSKIINLSAKECSERSGTTNANVI